MIKLIFSLVFFLIFLASFHVVFATSPETSSSAQLIFNTDHIANIFEKIEEKIGYYFKFTNESKLQYLEYLTEKRLAELSFVINNKQDDLIEETSSRYTTYLGNLTGFAVSNKMSVDKGSLKDMYKRHNIIVSDLQKNLQFESGWWLAVQHCNNLTKQFLDQIEKI